MGFLDDLKEGIRRGTEAAQRVRDEEAAKEAAKKAGKTGTATKPAAAKTGRQLPEGVYMVNLKNAMEPIVYGKDENGADFVLRVSGNIMFKQDTPDSTDAEELKKQVAAIAREKIEAALLTLDLSDQKARLVAANGLDQLIRDDLKAHGFTAVFKLPLILNPA